MYEDFIIEEGRKINCPFFLFFFYYVVIFLKCCLTEMEGKIFNKLKTNDGSESF